MIQYIKDFVCSVIIGVYYGTRIGYKKFRSQFILRRCASELCELYNRTGFEPTFIIKDLEEEQENT